jgi:hypothetical protein
MHNPTRKWQVLFHEDFEREFDSFAHGLQDELLAHVLLLYEFGPNLGRPTVDRLKGSRHVNMKELRFNWRDGVWRIAFAFDPDRHAILLVAGNKCGADQFQFYKRLLTKSDSRFDEHLASLSLPAGKKGKRGKKTE